MDPSLPPSSIESAVRRRGITSLYHFTHLTNLESILNRGLLSAQTLDEHQIPYDWTDNQRLDNQPLAVCFSIHGINEYMFAKMLNRYRCAFAILEVEASILWTHPRRFCWTNAANRVISKYPYPRGGLLHFDEMFKDSAANGLDGREPRKTSGRADNQPTMRDAEVQILASVSPDLICEVIVACESHRAHAQAVMAAAGFFRPIEVCCDGWPEGTF